MTNDATLMAISPLDGRYRNRLEALAPLVSEFGLIRNRVRVEVEWFTYLASTESISDLPPLSPADTAALRSVWQSFSPSDAAAVREIEATTNHDVKAVEYFVKGKLDSLPGLTAHTEFVHFACTSEDINNLSYALMLKSARDDVLLPAMDSFVRELVQLARPLVGRPMLSRTHGQAASPTTVGKELANVVARLRRQRDQVSTSALLGKMNGAVGNYNAHLAGYPDADWPSISRSFVESLGLAFNPYTTQIEPHDNVAELFHALMRFNAVLLDFDRDVWSYISIGYLRQRKVEGETGSSTMPHKVNPIDFENSEGNLGLANAVLEHLAGKLVISRWQRDLSDSTVLRSIGTAFGYSLVALSSARRGLGKLEVNDSVIEADLDQSWEVLAEAVQTIMRRAGAEEPYEALKTATRGRQLDRAVYEDLLAELDLAPTDRENLARIAPADYVGLAERLASEGLGSDIEVDEVNWSTMGDALRRIREAVFIKEQGIPADLEWDDADEEARHFAARRRGEIVGTGRLLPTGQIGRMAVLPAERGAGIGRAILDAAVAAARKQGQDIFLLAQADVVSFYEAAGFECRGPEFEEAGITHQEMHLP